MRALLIGVLFLAGCNVGGTLPNFCRSTIAVIKADATISTWTTCDGADSVLKTKVLEDNSVQVSCLCPAHAKHE